MEKGKKETAVGSVAGLSLKAQTRDVADEIHRLTESLLPDDDHGVRLARLLSDLRSGRRVTDFRFDQVFPSAMREHSETHWTPVQVAVRAASLLATQPNYRILDVGSGCGKFCLIGALTTNAMYVGIEQRATLIEIAKEARRMLGRPRAVFALGNMANLDWDFFDAFYLYNPFYEHQVDRIRIDQSLIYSNDTFQEYVQIVEEKLSKLRDGTRVATYHGFGGTFPPGFRRLFCEVAGTGFLELWERAVSAKPIYPNSQNRREGAESSELSYSQNPTE